LLKLAILDANERGNSSFKDSLVSYAAHWLAYEINRVALNMVAPKEADIIFLVHAGSQHWLKHCRKVKKYKDAYIITGGMIASSPLLAFQYVDAIAVGEAYRFMAEILGLIMDGADRPAIRRFIVLYPHAIEKSQFEELSVDDERPWLLKGDAPPLAIPDEYVNWSTPPVKTEGREVRLLASKGCHMKCAFCATSYSQRYQEIPGNYNLWGRVAQLSGQGENVMLITNDAAHLDGFDHLFRIGKLRAQSMTVRALRNQETLIALAKTNCPTIRLGVEGVSERLRKAFGKPVSNEELFNMIMLLTKTKHKLVLFFIIGDPYETAEDWQEFSVFLERLDKNIRNCLLRIKFTAFSQCAPAPLSRFLTAKTDYYDNMLAAWQDFLTNYCSRHIMLIKGVKPSSRLEQDEQVLGVNKKHLFDNHEGLIDLLPTLDHARRAPWEVVQWPLSVEKRWKISESYRKRMQHNMGLEPEHG
jgi:radical SAM superfamily enzyme YgiQ (UPF0313 family)